MLAKIGGLSILALCLLPGPGRAAEMPDASQPDHAKTILADQVREQGHPCETPIDAAQDVLESKPDEPVWFLRCSDATYRIRVRADMAAKIERVAGAP